MTHPELMATFKNWDSHSTRFKQQTLHKAMQNLHQYSLMMRDMIIRKTLTLLAPQKTPSSFDLQAIQ